MRQLTFATLITGVLLLAVGCGDFGSTARYTTNDTDIPQGLYNSSDDEQVKYIKVINYARSIGRSCGDESYDPALPFKPNSALYAAALEHSMDMAKSNTFSHVGSGESSDVTGSNLGHPSSFGERIDANGFTGEDTSENIAGGQETIEKVVTAWLESPGHCQNIMEPSYKNIGVAKYSKSGTRYTYYWTADFGS